MSRFEVPKEEYDRVSYHLAQLASEFDRPNKADQKVRDKAISLGEKYFTDPRNTTPADISQAKEFLRGHNRNPDAPIPPIKLIQPVPMPTDDWISVGDQLPTISENVNEAPVKVQLLVDDEVVELNALFINEQSGYNMFDKPCFVMLGRRMDRLNLDSGAPLIAEFIEPTHWRPREA
ncbi:MULTISPECIES: hypothetical protein [Burkholderia]|uniref:hypothetical protein n=1 Tax=Burkholderia TaxID=32008 RepID=UPI001CF2C95A|nr:MULTISPECIES: hypothetical protein [Burkholderia]MCA8240810.1 hypothetical protein [Burkholderia sp. AU32262]